MEDGEMKTERKKEIDWRERTPGEHVRGGYNRGREWKRSYTTRTAQRDIQTRYRDRFRHKDDENSIEGEKEENRRRDRGFEANVWWDSGLARPQPAWIQSLRITERHTARAENQM